MTAVTAGRGRFAKLDAAGNPVTGTESRSFALTDLDNAAAPRVVLNDPEGATVNDLPNGYAVGVDGRKSEVLAFQVRPDSAFTADTGDGTAAIAVQVHTYGANGEYLGSHMDTLELADRITPSGAAVGIPHPKGLAEDGVKAAGEFTDYLRFAPQPNEAWVLVGHAQVDVHDSG